ncbi:MAG: MATE family efflux transporter [Pseudophaeobacter sp.]|uniref:MATE family efflux transporter n=1 Tax=Pseudophaeobacter sp. TaxID=1971739 RepID=UPI003299C108
MVLSRLSELLVPTADLIMAGSSSSQELGYLGLGWAPWALTFVIASGLISSASVLFAQSAEQSHKTPTREIFHAGAMLAVLCGVMIIAIAEVSGPLFQLLGYQPDLAHGAAEVFQGYAYCMPFFLLQVHIAQYFGAQRRPWPEVIAVLITVLSNVGLNYLSMQGTGEASAAGIAFATSLARSLGALFLIIYLAFDQASVTDRLRHLSFDVPVFRKLFALGGPLACSFGLESATYFVMALMAARLGVIEVAGFQAGMNTLNLIYMITVGIGMAASVQSGRALGAADVIRVRTDTLVSCTIGFAIMALLSVGLLGYRDNVAELYSADPQVQAVIASGLLICTSYLVFEAMQVILKMALRGLGDVWVPLQNMIFAFWVVGIPLSWFLTFSAGWSTDGLFIGIGAAMFIAFVLNALRFRSLTSREMKALI